MNRRTLVVNVVIVLFAAALAGTITSCATAPDSTSVVGAVSADVAPAGDPADGPELEWPRAFQDGAISFSVYQPQIEQWDGLVLHSRAAVAVEPSNGGPPTYGVIWITGTTDVDKAARTVTLRNLEITKASFPTAEDRELAYLGLLRNHVPAVRVTSLDYFEANFAISQAVEKTPVVEVKNSVPRIIFSTESAILVLIDGTPVLRPVTGTSAQRVINTRVLILKLDGKYYLAALDRWYEANEIDGPWTTSSAPPTAALAQAKMALANAQQPMDLLDPAKGISVPAITPKMYVSTVPAELIQTQGKPDFLPIEGTELLQVKNSDSAIFLDIKSNEFFVLISGRWFKAPSLQNGPWTFVAGQELPADFARIPSDHPRANVLVSVPGTPQAQEAVIANSVPQTAAVNRNEAKVELTYDGPPRFVSIQTTPLEYAVNTPTPVIHVIGQGYYCVQDGVWFYGSSATGPWTVADMIPPVIYSIPPSCPIYYATYVRVYGSTPEVVYTGYTPGYFGTVVAPGYTVVYGTGYDYTPYIGDVWVGYPWTYGYGAGFACGYDTGFSFGFSAGTWFGVWPEVWWGPVGWGWYHHHYHYGHHSLNHLNFYDHWSPRAVSTHHGYASPYPRQVGLAHSGVFNPYSTRRQPGQGGWEGNAVSHVARNPHAANVGRPPANVYAGHDGQVFRHTGTSWEQHTRQGWSNAERNNSFQSQRGQLERDRSSRNLGQQRYEHSRPAAPPSHSGAPAHSGGTHHR